MLFIICLIVTIIFGILAIIFDRQDLNTASGICGIPAIATGFASIIMLVVLLLTYVSCPRLEAKWQERYASLNTRIEEHMYSAYDRAQLIEEVQEWNEDFAAQEKSHNNFWVGIFNPESIEGLDKIDLTRIN